MEEFKRISRDLVAKGAIIDYYQDTMQIPNGNIAKWDLIDHKGAAAVVAVREDGKLLMVRQYRNALDRYTLEIPAGKLDSPDEAKIDCAYRELEEETGYRCDHLEYLMSVNTTIAFCDEALDIFLARDLKKTHQHLDQSRFSSSVRAKNKMMITTFNLQTEIIKNHPAFYPHRRIFNIYH